MFIIGFIIFVIYVYFLIWNIFYSSKKQREENKVRLDCLMKKFVETSDTRELTKLVCALSNRTMAVFLSDEEL